MSVIELFDDDFFGFRTIGGCTIAIGADDAGREGGGEGGCENSMGLQSVAGFLVDETESIEDNNVVTGDAEDAFGG